MEALCLMPYREEDTSIYWIDSDTELARAVESWGAIIALDTEFIRTNTFYPIPGLYQVCLLYTSDAADES